MSAKHLSGKEIEDRCIAHFESLANDRSDPSAWITLYLDFSIPMRRGPKAAYLRCASSRSRQFLLPLLRPFCRLAIILIQVLKVVVPNRLQSPRLLHRTIYWGLKYFVSPEANYIILRHFNIGSQILEFIRSNIPNVRAKPGVLYPKTLEDITKDQIFLQHDLNLYNFILDLNFELKETGRSIAPPLEIDFSAIKPADFEINDLPNRWTNFLDVETALEIYTPFYQLLLRDSDFWRAQHSLQFDETVGIYVSRILGNPAHLVLLNNKHPLAPLTGTAAGFRLLLHGLSSENLYGLLCDAERLQQQGLLQRPML
jgi:hypothetical protein